MKKKEVKDYSACGTFFTGTYTVMYDENSTEFFNGEVVEIKPRWKNESDGRGMTVKVGTKVKVFKQE